MGGDHHCGDLCIDGTQPYLIILFPPDIFSEVLAIIAYLVLTPAGYQDRLITFAFCKVFTQVTPSLAFTLWLKN